jgi:DNA polymerase-4
VGDLRKIDGQTLASSLGQVGRHLHDLAHGRDPRPVETSRATKSVGHEETYAHDHHDHATLEREVVRMADAVASRMRSAGLSGRTVQLKVRYHDFKTITRSRTLPAPVDTAPAITRAAVEMLADVDVTPGVRLLGVSMSNLVSGAARQLTLDDLAAKGDWIETSEAIDAIRKRFGDSAVGPASLLEGGELRVKRVGQQQWGPTGRTDR